MNKLKQIFKMVIIGLTVVAAAILLAITVRGEPGNPSPVTIMETLRSEGKSFELSSERSRYGLAMSVVDNHSMQFTKEIAAIALPDLGSIHDKYVSLFAPGVSYVIIPLYIWGKTINFAQVAAFSTSAILALFNLMLIALIVRKITGNSFAGLLGGLVFTFGTVAWVYSGTLYEHHYSVFLILLATLLILSKNHFLKNLVVGVLFALSIFIEYPGGVFFLPLILWLIAKHVEFHNVSKKVRVAISFSIIWIVVGFAIGIVPSFMYNKGAYGNPFQLAGTVTTIRSFDNLDEAPKVAKPKTAAGFFHVEKLPQGLDVLLTSKDRGVIIFSPVILLGLLGLWCLRKENQLVASALLGEVLVVITLFSLWGDPWGGWAFGPRYLIPALAVLGIGVGIAVNKFRKKFWFGVVFFALFVYSCAVSLLGALTTIQIPPSVEPISATLPKFTYLHNLNLLQQGITGSFIFNSYFKDYLSLVNLEIYMLIGIFVLAIICYLVNPE